jgi:hypothetical protein
VKGISQEFMDSILFNNKTGMTETNKREIITTVLFWNLLMKTAPTTASIKVIIPNIVTRLGTSTLIENKSGLLVEDRSNNTRVEVTTIIEITRGH